MFLLFCFFWEDCLPFSAKTLYITLFAGKTGQIIRGHIFKQKSIKYKNIWTKRNVLISLVELMCISKSIFLYCCNPAVSCDPSFSSDELIHIINPLFAWVQLSLASLILSRNIMLDINFNVLILPLNCIADFSFTDYTQTETVF